MSKTSIFLMVIFLLALTALLSLNTMYSTNPVLTSFPAIFPTQPEAPSENTLILNPQAFTANAGRSANVQVLIDSKGEHPSLIQLELSYDPGIISAVKITPGTFFANPQVLLNNINARNGRISYAIAPTSEQDQSTDSNLAATISFIPVAVAARRQTSLTFMPKTLVRTKHSENALKSTIGTQITILQGNAPIASPEAQILNY